MLSALLMLGANFGDPFIETIRPKQRLVGLDNGSTLPLLRRTLNSGSSAPVEAEIHETRRHGRKSRNIKEAEKKIVPPHSHV